MMGDIAYVVLVLILFNILILLYWCVLCVYSEAIHKYMHTYFICKRSSI
jgi:hypothetical protein